MSQRSRSWDLIRWWWKKCPELSSDPVFSGGDEKWPELRFKSKVEQCWKRARVEIWSPELSSDEQRSQRVGNSNLRTPFFFLKFFYFI
jgi:hypothetical protein